MVSEGGGGFDCGQGPLKLIIGVKVQEKTQPGCPLSMTDLSLTRRIAPKPSPGVRPRSLGGGSTVSIVAATEASSLSTACCSLM